MLFYLSVLKFVNKSLLNLLRILFVPCITQSESNNLPLNLQSRPGHNNSFEPPHFLHLMTFLFKLLKGGLLHFPF